MKEEISIKTETCFFYSNIKDFDKIVATTLRKNAGDWHVAHEKGDTLLKNLQKSQFDITSSINVPADNINLVKGSKNLP